MRIRPSLITFDFGDTLVTSDPPYLTRIWMALQELGVKRALSEVEKAYHFADWRTSEELFRQKDFAPKKYQQLLGETLLKELGVKSGTGQLLRELARWLTGMRPERVMVPGAEKLLRELKRRGYRMGIISNNDGRTCEKCRAVGIEEYFSFILDSTLEQMVKPDPEFFKKALAISGARPEDSLHVGDLWGSDILGASSAGFWAAWLWNGYLRPGRKSRVFRIERPDQVLNFLA